MKVRLIAPNVPYYENDQTTPIQAYGPTIADIAGGFTATQAVGGWKDDTGKLIVESVTVFDVHCENREPNAHRQSAEYRFRQLAERITRDLSQDCVYLEIDGKVELIKPDLPSQPVGR